MNGKRIRIYAENRYQVARIGIGIVAHDLGRAFGEPGRISVPKALEFSPIEMGVTSGPLLEIDKDSATELMDSLWVAGIRPTQATSGDAALDATKAHLADMQKLSHRLLDSLLSPRMIVNPTNA